MKFLITRLKISGQELDPAWPIRWNGGKPFHATAQQPSTATSARNTRFATLGLAGQ